MSVENNAGYVTLREAYSWLNEFDGSFLSTGSHYWVRKMKSFIAAGDNAKAWHAQNRLRNSVEGITDEREVAEILVECGKAAHDMGHYLEAATLLEKSIVRYKWRHHQVAIVRWMLGHVYWGIRDRRCDTFPTWEASIRLFNELMRKQPSENIRSRWYLVKITKMEFTLLHFIEQDC